MLLLYLALARGPVTLVSPLIATFPLATIAISALCFTAASTAARGWSAA